MQEPVALCLTAGNKRVHLTATHCNNSLQHTATRHTHGPVALCLEAANNRVLERALCFPIYSSLAYLQHTATHCNNTNRHTAKKLIAVSKESYVSTKQPYISAEVPSTPTRC